MKDLYPSVATLLAATTLSLQVAAQAPVHKQTVSTLLLTGPKTVSATFPSASTAGNLIVVEITWDQQSRTLSTTSPVVDTKGNTYTRIGTETNWGTKYRSALYYAYNINADATKIKVTATLTNNTTQLLEIYISEYSNVLTTSDPLDKFKTATGTGTTINTGSVTTTATNELIYGVSVGENSPIHGGTGGYTIRSTDQDNIVEDRSAAIAGSYNVPLTATASTNWIAQMATFKPLIPLPVTLLSFDARSLSNKSVELSWATASESNSDHFEIQHSPDGQGWTTIGQTASAGNSDATQRYSYIDDAPYSGTTYYRLRQVDRDGNSTFSKILTTHTDQGLTVRVYPNPTASYVIVEGATQPGMVFNTAGQRMTVRVNTESPTKYMLDLSPLPRGTYFVSTGDRSTLVYKD